MTSAQPGKVSPRKERKKPARVTAAGSEHSSPAKVVAYVRDAIAEGEMWPNERLVEADLAKRLGVSRTPVREAIRELARLGLVRTVRNRGAFVVATNSKELQELYSIRAVLEGMAARLATGRIPDSEIDRLETLNEGMMKAVNEGELLDFVQLNDEFHRTLYLQADNKNLYEMLMNILERTSAMRRKLWRSEQVARSSVQKHVEIIAAIRARDEEAVERLLRGHIRWTGLSKNWEIPGPGRRQDSTE